jgi:hypothetical protein
MNIWFKANWYLTITADLAYEQVGGFKKDSAV